MSKGVILLVKLENNETIKGAFECPPFGLMYIADALRKAEYEVKIFHKEWCPSFKKTLFESVSGNIVLVGFSTLTSPALDSTIQASMHLKKEFPRIPIVWGGVHASLLPVQTLRNDFVDIVVIGEGEETLVEVADAILEQRRFETVNGIAYKKKGLVKLSKPRQWINLDTYVPAWDLVDVNKYFTKSEIGKRVLSFVTSRGCPYGCTFCYNTAFNRRTWRAHRLGYVVSQLKMLKKELGIDGVYFQDDNFFTDKKRAYEILKKIQLPWYAEIRADYLTKKDVDKMIHLNCQRLEIGVESGSPRILQDILKKDITQEDVVRAVRLCKDKIPLLLSFIVGIPTETRQELYETMNFIEHLFWIETGNILKVNVLVPYPGTEIYNHIPNKYKPENTLGWRFFNRKRVGMPWLNQEQRKIIHFILVAAKYFYVGSSKTKANQLLQRMLQFRWRYKVFNLFIEDKLIELKTAFLRWRLKHRKVRARR